MGMIGNFANQGRTWRQAPEQVNLHDFPGDALRAVPYGIYDIVHNQGYVYLGNSYDTPERPCHRTVVGRPGARPLSA